VVGVEVGRNAEGQDLAVAGLGVRGNMLHGWGTEVLGGISSMAGSGRKRRRSGK
jgi:hypothetical protein